MLEKLQADAKDDLYFAGGRDRLTFRNLLASGHLPQPLLARCVDLSHSALGGGVPATEMWEEILTGVACGGRHVGFTQCLRFADHTSAPGLRAFRVQKFSEPGG